MTNFLATSGDGEDWWGDPWICPDWYPVIRASRFLHVAPWELLPSSAATKIERGWWLLWSTISESAEARATKLLNERKA